MRRLLLSLAVLALFNDVVVAAPAEIAATTTLGVPAGFQQLTMNGTAQSLTPSGTYAVIISAAAFTWRDDGTAPTLAVGMVWPANVPLVYGGTLAAIQIIATASSTVNVSYYK
jgi:hypothetical protein